jgi:hypothetical protein
MSADVVGIVDSLGYLFCSSCADRLGYAGDPVRGDTGPHNEEPCDECGQVLIIGAAPAAPVTGRDGAMNTETATSEWLTLSSFSPDDSERRSAIEIPAEYNGQQSFAIRGWEFTLMPDGSLTIERDSATVADIDLRVGQTSRRTVVITAER